MINKIKALLKSPRIVRVELINPDNSKKYMLSVEAHNNPSDYTRFKLTRKWLIGYGKDGKLLRKFNINYLYTVSY